MSWAGHIARMMKGEVLTLFCLGSPKARDRWEDIGLGGSITLMLTFGRELLLGRTGIGWLRIGSNGGLL
jgi:hypothetical protein